jgi:hypothetical protein
VDIPLQVESKCIYYINVRDKSSSINKKIIFERMLGIKSLTCSSLLGYRREFKLYWEAVKWQKTIYEPLHRILKIEHHGGERRCPERNLLRYQGERFHSIVLWFRRIIYDIPVKKSKLESWCQSYAQNIFFLLLENNLSRTFM